MLSLIICLAPELAPNNAIAAALQARAERLNGLVVELRSEIFLRTIAFGEQIGAEHPKSSHDFRLTIAGGGVLSEFLTDNPDAGYEPNTESLTGGVYVSRQVRPNKFGMATINTVEGTIVVGSFGWSPLLAVYDVQLMDCNIPGTNLASIVQSGAAKVVGSTDSGIRYTADFSEPGSNHHLEFELASDGLATFVRDTLELVGMGAKPIVREQTVRKTGEVAGVRIPVETWVTVENPNVQGIQTNTHILTATNYSVDPNLTRNDVTIPVERRNAFVTTRKRDGTSLHEHFDASGAITESFVTMGASVVNTNDVIVPRESVGWRRAIPPVAGVFGVLTAAGFYFVSRRRV